MFVYLCESVYVCLCLYMCVYVCVGYINDILAPKPCLTPELLSDERFAGRITVFNYSSIFV